MEALLRKACWEMEEEHQIYANIEMHDEVQDAQRMSTNGCWVPSDGMEPTVQSVMMLQQTKLTRSGPTFRNNRCSSKQRKNRRFGACIRCTTSARWIARKTIETENATKGEHPEEWCTSSTLARRRGRW